MSRSYLWTERRQQYVFKNLLKFDLFVIFQVFADNRGLSVNAGHWVRGVSSCYRAFPLDSLILALMLHSGLDFSLEK